MNYESLRIRLYGKHQMTNQQVADAIVEFEYLIEQVEKLQAFKEYVHDRLDKMGIEKDPESEHKEHGCRIGGRLDLVQEYIDCINRSEPEQLTKENK